MQKTGNKIKYSLVKGVWKLFSLLPLSVMYGLSDVLFYPLYYWIRYRRRITRKNLTESFPEKTLQQLIAIEKRFYRFFIDMMFEMCKMASFSKQEINKRIRFVGIEEINRLLESGNSISLFVGHCGNWEWMSSMPLHLPKNVVSGQIYHRLHNSLVDKLLLQNRSRWGANTVEMKETLRWIHTHVRQGQVTIMGYIADQAPRWNNTQHYVRFLNHQTYALTGAEKITRKYGFEAYYLDIERKRRGYYEVHFVRMCERPQSLPEFELTDIYFNLLEQTIRKHPEYYLWTHNRFKHATTKIVQEVKL
ncbi:MAG: lysophospholipid acyltransferase family protein [Candidatus Azobacteroides sp.]|nr:lysophospholipid acyltransferase family protein [Candidatus Azobacteroides sp.]